MTRAEMNTAADWLENRADQLEGEQEASDAGRITALRTAATEFDSAIASDETSEEK